jgi:ribosome-associated protein
MINDPNPAKTADGDSAAAAQFDQDRPSKSQRKRDMLALQEIGSDLVKLSTDQVSKLDLPEKLREAVLEAQRITSHEGKRRQLQLVGKLMRQVDPAPIEEQLAAIRGESRGAVVLMHRCERWRDRLIEDDAALTEFLAEHAVDDVQPLRAMIRAARKEHAGGQPPKHARELYRLLHARLSSAE